MPIWASRSGLQGIRIPNRLWTGSGKATFAYRFVNCNEISVINQRFLNKTILTPNDDLQRAFDAAVPGSRFYLEAGVYRQKVLLCTPGLQIEGTGINQTTIIWDDYANKLHEDGQEYNTFRTYTMAICADHVSMRNLSIINDAGHPENKGQEVALSVLGNDFLMENCRLSSTQDTLFAGPLPSDLIARYKHFLIDNLRAPGPFRQRYTRCLIEGSFDFTESA